MTIETMQYISVFSPWSCPLAGHSPSRLLATYRNETLAVHMGGLASGVSQQRQSLRLESLSLGPPKFLSGGTYGFCALACVAAAAGAKRSTSLPVRKAVGFATKTTVLAATLSVANGVVAEFAERRSAPIFLRSRCIEPQVSPNIDRMSSWDADNWSLIGGAAGLFAATRRPCPLPSVSRTVWCAVQVMSGVWIASWGYWAQRAAIVGLKLDPRQAMYDRLATQLNRASYQPKIAREVLLDAISSVPEALQHVQMGTIKLSPEIASALKAKTHNPSFGPRRATNGSQNVFEQILESPNHSDSFHKPHVPDNSFEPTPYSLRNYDWSSITQHDRAIPELETHISQLHKRRQQACNEAEAVRDWLHE